MTPSSHATIQPIHPYKRYVGYCGICDDPAILLTHADTELPLGSQHLCGACVASVVTADVALNGVGVGLVVKPPLTRPPRGCEADGDVRRR